MAVYNVVTAICFTLLTVAVIYTAVSFAVKNREDRIAYLRSFKKGKCAVVLVLAIPLFCIGFMYGGADFFTAFFKAVGNTVNLVVLKYSLSDISALMNADLFYKITVYYCCILVLLNALLFTFSLTSQQIRRFASSVYLRFSRKPKLYIFGYNKDNVNVYKSAGRYAALIIDGLSAEDRLFLYRKKINYKNLKNYEAAVCGIMRRISRDGAGCTVVINTGDDGKNLNICRLFNEQTNEAVTSGGKELFSRLRVYVFGNPAHEAVYGQAVAQSSGCIQYKNKYLMLAARFTDRYPLSSFMDGRNIDYETALVKKQTQINVCLIGFGNANRRIFLSSVANNQFLCRDGKGLSVKPVKYFIFDKNASEENKNLNHTYYRFKNEFSDADAAEYLPLPPPPATEEYRHLDVNSPDFYSDIRKAVSCENGVGFIIISFGTDLENIDLAGKLAEKRAEWGLNGVAIFVKVRDAERYGKLVTGENCYPIGDEKSDVYDIEQITNDKISRMAKLRDYIYELEKRITSDAAFTPTEQNLAECRQVAEKKWFTEKSRLERESSLYCCLSLRSKLNMLGLDYCDAENCGQPALSESEYMQVYAVGDAPDALYNPVTADGKKIINYTLDFPESKRKNLAVAEHYRWNAFMLSNGVMPADKNQILNETAIKNGKTVFTNGKNYNLRRHGNITTFDGLAEFRHIVAERDNVDESETDVIKYDYQLMDDAYWLLTRCGFKIVRRV